LIVTVLKELNDFISEPAALPIVGRLGSANQDCFNMIQNGSGGGMRSLRFRREPVLTGYPPNAKP
jgi:hypothetical protein